MAVLPSCFLAKVYFFIYNNESSKAGGEGKLMGSIQKPVNLWPLWPWVLLLRQQTQKTQLKPSFQCFNELKAG